MKKLLLFIPLLLFGEENNFSVNFNKDKEAEKLLILNRQDNINNQLYIYNMNVDYSYSLNNYIQLQTGLEFKFNENYLENLNQNFIQNDEYLMNYKCFINFKF